MFPISKINISKSRTSKIGIADSALIDAIELIENEEDYVSSTMKIFNNELGITLVCSEPSLGFKDLTDSQISSIFNVEDASFKFEMDYGTLNKVKNLFGLDKEETFSIEANGKGVKLTGSTYNMLVTPDYDGQQGTKVTLFKKYLNLLDKECSLKQ